MNFQQLEYILAVDKQKHFGLAADNCGVTQATLSAMIKKLEEELEVLIFDRSKRQVKTTEAGQKVLEIAAHIVDQKRDLYQVKQQPERLEGKLRIGVIPTTASSLLPLVLPRLLAQNENLNLDISEITTEEITHKLLEDKLDLGILATPLNEDRLEETILYYEAMLVYGAADSQKKFINSKDLQHDKVWLLEEGHCFRNQVTTICEIQTKSTKDLHLNFNGNSFETLLSLSNEFGGYTLVPELYAQTLGTDKSTKIRSFQKPIPVREISLVAYRQVAHQASINLLAEHIINAVSPQLSTSKMKNKDLDIIGIN